MKYKSLGRISFPKNLHTLHHFMILVHHIEETVFHVLPESDRIFRVGFGRCGDFGAVGVDVGGDFCAE